MDIGSICLCLAVGALIVFASIGIGVCFGRCKRVRKYSNEEMIFVLHNLKRLTHGWERDIVDAMIEEKEGKVNERKKMEL